MIQHDCDTTKEILNFDNIQSIYLEKEETKKVIQKCDNDIRNIRGAFDKYQILAIINFTIFGGSTVFLGIYGALLAFGSLLFWLSLSTHAKNKKIEKAKNLCLYDKEKSKLMNLKQMLENKKDIIFNEETIFSHVQLLDNIKQEYAREYSNHFLDYCIEKHQVNFSAIKSIFFNSYREKNIDNYFNCVGDTYLLRENMKKYLDSYITHCNDDIEEKYNKNHKIIVKNII